MTETHFNLDDVPELGDLLEKAEAHRLRYAASVLFIALSALAAAVFATHLYLPNLSLTSVMQSLLLSTLFLLLLYAVFSISIPRILKLSLSLVLFIILAITLDVDRTNAVFILSTGPLVGFYFGHSRLESYQNIFRQNLVRSLLQRCNLTARYSPELALAPTHLLQSSVAPFYPRTIQGSDKISDTAYGVAYEYAYETANYDSGTFEGIVMTAQLPAPFKTTILLNPIEIESENAFALFKTHDADFDHIFHCYSTEVQKAQILLGDSFRKALLTLYRDFPGQFMMKMDGRRLYLFFPFPHCFSHLPILRSLSTCEGLTAYPCLSRRFESIILTLLHEEKIR